jgi:hypothetical protein
LRDLPCEHLEVDEIWNFIAKKAKRASGDDRGAGRGDDLTFVAIDEATKVKDDREQFVAILESPLLDSAKMAVQAQIVKDARRPTQ